MKKYAILYAVLFNDMGDKYREYTFSPCTLIEVDENKNHEYTNIVHGKLSSIDSGDFIVNDDLFCIEKAYSLYEIRKYAKERFKLNLEEKDALKFYFDVFKNTAIDGLYNFETSKFKHYDRINYDDIRSENNEDYVPFEMNEVKDLYKIDSYKELVKTVRDMVNDQDRYMNINEDSVFFHKDVIIKILKTGDREVALYELYKFLQETFKDIPYNLPKFDELMDKGHEKEEKLISINYAKQKSKKFRRR